MMTLSALPSASGSAYMSPWRRLEAMPAASSLTRASRSISDERSMPIACGRARPEQFDHPPGAGADVDQPPERPLAQRALDRLLDLALGDVERADRVPHLGMGGEIAGGGLGAVGANRVEPRRVGREQRFGRPVGPAIEQREHRLGARRVGERQEHPAAFLAALDHAGVGEDLEVARNARLALAEHLRELADRQLHSPQQREDAQPGRVGERLEQVGKGKDRRHEIRI